MLNGRFLIIGSTVSEPYHSSNFFIYLFCYTLSFYYFCNHNQ